MQDQHVENGPWLAQFLRADGAISVVCDALYGLETCMLRTAAQQVGVSERRSISDRSIPELTLN